MPREKKQGDKIIKKKTRISVSNTLNQMIFEQKDMNLQAFRMIMFYLAKINPKHPEFTEVKVPLETYAEMLGVELNEQAISESTELLLGYRLKFTDIDDGKYIIKFAKYNIFSVCRLMARKSDGKQMLEFKCTEDIKPLIFELQEKFTYFNVWNVLNLSNFQDIRMYMLLSQYKVAGTRTISIEDLKGHLGIDKDAYPEYKIFARDVLKKCQKALKKRTDICFEFKSVGRPAHSVFFDISPNTEYTILKYLEDESTEQAACQKQLPGQMTLDDLGDDHESEDLEVSERTRREELCDGFQSSFYDEFTYEQLAELVELSWAHIDKERVEQLREGKYLSAKDAREKAAEEYIRRKILLANAKKDVTHRYAFIKAAVAEDWR